MSDFRLVEAVEDGFEREHPLDSEHGQQVANEHFLGRLCHQIAVEVEVSVEQLVDVLIYLLRLLVVINDEFCL